MPGLACRRDLLRGRKVVAWRRQLTGRFLDCDDFRRFVATELNDSMRLPGQRQVSQEVTVQIKIVRQTNSPMRFACEQTGDRLIGGLRPRGVVPGVLMRGNGHDGGDRSRVTPCASGSASADFKA